MSDIESQNQQMRIAFMQSFEKMFFDIISFLNRLPLHPQVKTHSFMNFDQAAFWARQAIAGIQFEPQAQTETTKEEACTTDCEHKNENDAA